MGFTFYTHPEVEFFLLKDLPSDGSAPEPADPAATSTSPRTTWPTTSGARRSSRWRRWASRWSSATTRSRPGQQEIDLRYADALSTADNIMTLRHVVREVARAQGVHATFMPKPFTELAGSAMHTHLSLFEGDRNAFHDPGGPAVAVGHRQALHRRPAAARPRDHRGHQPEGELLQAAAGRHRGADGGHRAAPTGRRWSGCRCTSRARPTRPWAPPPFTITPFRAARLMPPMNATGAAISNGHGVASTSTSAKRTGSPESHRRPRRARARTA